jgi:hypothetical protein
VSLLKALGGESTSLPFQFLELPAFLGLQPIPPSLCVTRISVSMLTSLSELDHLASVLEGPL